MRYLILLLLLFAFNSFTQVPKPGYGLPELATEEWKKQLNSKKRAKVMSPSVARKVQKVIEALDEAGILEQSKALLKKRKKIKKQMQKIQK